MFEEMPGGYGEMVRKMSVIGIISFVCALVLLWLTLKG